MAIFCAHTAQINRNSIYFHLHALRNLMNISKQLYLSNEQIYCLGRLGQVQIYRNLYVNIQVDKCTHYLLSQEIPIREYQTFGRQLRGVVRCTFKL